MCGQCVLLQDKLSSYVHNSSSELFHLGIVHGCLLTHCQKLASYLIPRLWRDPGYEAVKSCIVCMLCTDEALASQTDALSLASTVLYSATNFVQKEII